jgi:hypothetical protein
MSGLTRLIQFTQALTKSWTSVSYCGGCRVSGDDVRDNKFLLFRDCGRRSSRSDPLSDEERPLTPFHFGFVHHK